MKDLSRDGKEDERNWKEALEWTGSRKRGRLWHSSLGLRDEI